MTTPADFPSFDESSSAMEVLVGLSRHYGSIPAFVLAGGGNTSMKTDDRLFVKASGYPLAAIDADGFVEMDRFALAKILDEDYGAEVVVREARFKQAILEARCQPESGLRPSVECVLHNLLPVRFVVHTHPTAVNMLTCCTLGAELAAAHLPDDVLWVDYVDPGYVLAGFMRERLAAHAEATGRAFPPVILIQNHGLIVCGETPEEIRRRTDELMEAIDGLLAGTHEAAPFGPVTAAGDERRRELINTIGPALRGLLAAGRHLPVVTFDDSPVALELAGGRDGQGVAMGGAVMPDQIVYCRALPMWFDPSGSETCEELVERLRAAVDTHRATLSMPPVVVAVQGLGVFAAGDGLVSADWARAVYLDAVKVMAGAKRLGGIRHMTTAQRDFIESWEAEAYRRKVAAGRARAGRVAGKVAVVTGAAQGFGLEIARDLASQGAHVVLMDINRAGVHAAAQTINTIVSPGRATGLRVDVSNGPSVAEAMHQMVRTFGGFDLLVSNAGVLRAESVKTQPEADFDFVTRVNYKGYFLCVQNAAPILAAQHRAKDDCLSDIIQINSKSGLIGSNRNAAYAGSKFGGIGLTQSFAMELVTDGIKVNSICPGNFFDGPLWSDPETGLFVQYLQAGKVPGAKTIADVRRAYEAKVPMGRGCTTGDIMTAIYYLIEQQYETGQALPVTGGQVMLR